MTFTFTPDEKKFLYHQINETYKTKKRLKLKMENMMIYEDLDEPNYKWCEERREKALQIMQMMSDLLAKIDRM